MEKKWVGAWGNAVSISQRRPENYAKDITLRYPIKMTLDGQAIRITLDNFCGGEDVFLTHSFAAVSDGEDGILPETSVGITFSGSVSTVIKQGERLVSDPVPLSVKRGQFIAISLYFGGFTHMRSSARITGPLSKGYSAVGDQTENERLDADTSNSTAHFYFLTDVDVLTDSGAKTLICYGDSITAQDWPDYLIGMTLDSDMNTAVVRKAASGTRVLRQYDNITYESYGLKGETRFPREIAVSGAKAVLIQHGINDIIHPVGVEVNRFRPWSDLPTAEDIINGYRFYIRLAREAGLKVYFGTLLPIKGWRTYADFREKLRNEVNDWIRTNDEADGFVDFDAAVRDPEDTAAFAKGFDSGDHLHPNAAAYKRMAQEAFSLVRQLENGAEN